VCSLGTTGNRHPWPRTTHGNTRVSIQHQKQCNATFAAHIHRAPTLEEMARSCSARVALVLLSSATRLLRPYNGHTHA
jgi:hypothetical protein